MSFLAPVLLAGLAALAIPVIVHLVQRERRRVVEFPSLMFLRKIPYQSVRRRAIRHWPLLLLRLLALILIVFAFARPYLPGASISAASAGGGRDVIVLLDRSFSMGYGDRWARAQDEARRVVRALGPDDRATLALFAADVEIAVQSSAERGALLGAIARAEPTAASTRYGPAVRAAGGLLAASEAPRRDVVMISDFQQSGWDRAQDHRLPPGVAFTATTVAEAGAANAGVAGLTLERLGQAGRDQVRVTARIANHGEVPIANRPVALEVDGRRVETGHATVPPRSSGAVEFGPFALGGNAARVTIRLDHDPLPIDDQFHAVVSRAAPVPVLIIESVNPSPDSSLYLAGALAVARTPPFDTRVTRVDRVTPADVERAAVVVLNDSRPPAGPGARSLEARVRAGAGLLVVLGGQATWPPGAPDLLPGILEGLVDRSGTRGGALGYVDYGHPVFEIFRQPRSGDLTAPRVFRYRTIAPSGPVIARFDDGTPAIVERRVERGTVLAWASTLDSHWNDLALKPVFVPFVHEALKHLAHYVEPRPWLVVGDVFDPAALVAPGGPAAGMDPADLAIVPPGGGREPLALDEAGPRASGGAGPTAAGAPGRTRLARLTEAGFHHVRPLAAGAADVAMVAVNVSAAESDLAPLDTAEFVRAMTAGTAPRGAGAVQDLGATGIERRQRLWWYLLAAGLILLVAEGVVASRLPRVA